MKLAYSERQRAEGRRGRQGAGGEGQRVAAMFQLVDRP
jgi:hypothetical protein